MNKQSRENIAEIVRFLIVGIVATVCDYATFCLFDAVLFPLLPVAGKAWQTLFLTLSTALGFIIGLIVSWILSISFVFAIAKNNPKARTPKAFGAFTLIALVGLAITELGVVALVALFPNLQIFGTDLFLGTEWRKWIAKAVMTCIVLIWNYIARKRFVFRKK